MDRVYTFIYDKDTRIKAVALEKSLLDIFEAQKIEKQEERTLFRKAALLAVAFSSEEKDDSGSVYVSIKNPTLKIALTALCETDGRLRGAIDEYVEGSFNEVILTVGRRLVTRGDYQSSVMGKSLEEATEEYFVSSRQTKAKCIFSDFGFVFAEYFPGHDVNFKDENKKPSLEKIMKKNDEAIKVTEDFFEGKKNESLKEVSMAEISFGCTCNKRKIKAALVGVENTELPLEVKCRFCGKMYTIDNI